MSDLYGSTLILKWKYMISVRRNYYKGFRLKKTVSPIFGPCNHQLIFFRKNQSKDNNAYGKSTSVYLGTISACMK